MPTLKNRDVIEIQSFRNFSNYFFFAWALPCGREVKGERKAKKNFKFQYCERKFVSDLLQKRANEEKKVWFDPESVNSIGEREGKLFSMCSTFFSWSFSPTKKLVWKAADEKFHPLLPLLTLIEISTHNFWVRFSLCVPQSSLNCVRWAYNKWISSLYFAHSILLSEWLLGWIARAEEFAKVQRVWQRFIFQLRKRWRCWEEKFFLSFFSWKYQYSFRCRFFHHKRRRRERDAPSSAPEI